MKKLASGYTTGTCAQAATKAAMQQLLTGTEPKEVEVDLPGGKRLNLLTKKRQILYGKGSYPEKATCAIQKDSGDDPDITNGVLVYSTVEWSREKGVSICGGEGIGKVTKAGLDQPIGEAAINRIPRKMIEKEVKRACEEAGCEADVRVTIRIPGGEELAKKTFNPRLGIVGGLSILGTSGIVEPMSEQALKDTIRVELQVKLAQGETYILAAPGNYGLDFLRKYEQVQPEAVVKCSNYIGETIDMAKELGAKGLLFAGHIGKLVKVAGGIMNTHSRWGDCRMEILAAAALRSGLQEETACRILRSVTTDEALGLCGEAERKRLMQAVMEKIEEYLTIRGEGEIRLGAILFSNVYGILGETRSAAQIWECRRRQQATGQEEKTGR